MLAVTVLECQVPVRELKALIGAGERLGTCPGDSWQAHCIYSPARMTGDNGPNSAQTGQLYIL